MRTLIQSPGVSLSRSLGWLATWWVENFVLVGGNGSVKDDLVRFGDEYMGFVVRAYALDDAGFRLHDSAFFSRPKGSNKSGLAAYLALFEAFGPCRFAGWAEGGETYSFLGREYVYERGEPMGRGLAKPFVRIMATAEDQVSNVYDTVLLNVSDGPLAGLRSYGLDAGLSRVVTPDGGRILPSTSGDASKDGGLETFSVFDETHQYVLPGLRGMYATVTRNMSKNVEGFRQKWFLETTTMYQPGEDSVAERTYEFANLIQEGRARNTRLLFDHRFARLTDAEFTDSSDAGDARLRAAIVEALGEAVGWNDVDAIVNHIYDPRNDVSASKRFFLNDIAAARDAWLEPAQLEPLLVDDGLRPGDQVTLGFDGAVSNDASALVACRVSDGLLVPLRIDEVPDGPEALTWTVDQEAFDAAVADAFATFDVVGFFADPPFWQDWVAKWEREYGANLRVRAGRDAISFFTNRDSLICPAVERLHTDVVQGRVRFADRKNAAGVSLPLDVQFRRHFVNARAAERRGGTVIYKESKKSPKKIDAAMAGVLAWAARGEFVDGGSQVRRKRAAFVPMYVRG